MTLEEAFRELNEAEYKKGVNNKTLKEVLLSIAKLIVPEQLEATTYEVHHLDYDNTNNAIYNISLMPTGKHKSFHAKAKNLDRQQKDELFKDYYEACIQVGNLLINYININGSNSENNII